MTSIEEQTFDAGLDAIDKLISNAAAATDACDFGAAINGFKQALVLTRQLFGEQTELEELEKMIAEIRAMMDNS